MRILLALLLTLPLSAAPPRCTITSATLAVAPAQASAGAIVLATAHITVASPCVMRPVLKVDAGLLVHQYADASSLGDALIEWPVTATAAGVYRVDLVIDGAVWDSATLTVGAAERHALFLPLVARGAEAVWLPQIHAAAQVRAIE